MTLPPAAQDAVRLAKSEDMPAWGQIQAQAMRADLQSHLGQVGPQSLALIDPGEIAGAWRQALENPPSPKHHLLSAISGSQVVGLAAIAPAPKMLFKPKQSPLAGKNADAEIVALEVADWESNLTDASRLVNAVGDMLRLSGANRLQIWLAAGAQEKIRFFSECGFAPAGLRQGLKVGHESMVQHLWFTDL